MAIEPDGRKFVIIDGRRRLRRSGRDRADVPSVRACLSSEWTSDGDSPEREKRTREHDIVDGPSGWAAGQYQGQCAVCERDLCDSEMELVDGYWEYTCKCPREHDIVFNATTGIGADRVEVICAECWEASDETLNWLQEAQ